MKLPILCQEVCIIYSLKLLNNNSLLLCLTQVIKLLCAANLLHPIVIQKQRRPIQVSALSKNSGKQPCHKYSFHVGLIQNAIV